MAPKKHQQKQTTSHGRAAGAQASSAPGQARRTAVELTAASEASVRSILQVRSIIRTDPAAERDHILP